MHQPSLHQLLGIAPPTSTRRGGLRVIDLFCGGGGFSCGAVQAGCDVILAVDANEEAIEYHRRNHPSTTHVVATMPCERLALPDDGKPFHLHLSPPCQAFSTNRTRGVDRTDVSRDMVEWSLRFALTSKATTWSLEEVNAPPVRATLDRIKAEFPAQMDWHVFPFCDLGVPQTRKRVIAGPPALVAALKARCCRSKRRSIRDAFGAKARAPYVRNAASKLSGVKRANPNPQQSRYIYKKATWADFCKPIDGPAPVACAGNVGLHWILHLDSDTRPLRFTPRESAVLQTFPESYKLPDRVGLAHLLVGNAVPPLVSKQIMECAVELTKRMTA
jgi:DNA (cytosine-5)-methyltransferase 1